MPAPAMKRRRGSRFLHNLDDVLGEAAALRPLLLKASMLMPSVRAGPRALTPEPPP